MIVKKLLTISLLIFALLQLLNYAPVLVVWQHHIYTQTQKLIAQGLPEAILEKVTITPENEKLLVWEKANKEFWYQGKLYDIVKVATTSKSTIYYCLQDTKETQVVKSFEQQKQTDSNANSILQWEFAKKIAYIPTYTYTQATEKPFLLLPLYLSVFYSSYQNLYKSQLLSEKKEPPKFFEL